MKKHAYTGRTAIVAAVILIMATIMAAPAPAADYEWGSPMAKIKKAISPGASVVEFSPADDPNYENKILSYITAIDADLVKKITIVRVKTQPVVDYLFVNDRLYTVMENWGDVEPGKSKEIETGLTTQYGAPLAQQDKNFFTYSFNNDRTKVLFYLVKLENGKAKCIVYYYTKKLFRILITE